MKLFLLALLVVLATNCCTRPIESGYLKDEPIDLETPSLEASVEGMNEHDSVITRAKLLNAKRIIPRSNSFQIVSFTYLLGNCELAAILVTGSEFSEFNKKHFSTVRPAPMIHFYDIKARDTNGNIIALSPFDYKFVE